jgi:hypothetical protein
LQLCVRNDDLKCIEVQLVVIGPLVGEEIV